MPGVMRIWRCIPGRSVAGWLAIFAMGLGGLHIMAPAASAGVTVTMTASAATVAPDSEFDVYLQITQAGSTFNAFDAIIGYDPAALTLLPLSPQSQQVGSLMSSACGSQFHRFRQGADRDTISLALLCSNTSVSGPGPVYRLRFRTSSTFEIATISFLPGLRFYNAGVYVLPVSSTNLTISTSVSGVPVEPGKRPGDLRLYATPNPSRALTTLLIESQSDGAQELLISDVLGRVVRRLDSGWFAAGRRELRWDGFSDSGEAVPPGVYYARLLGATGAAKATVVRLR